MKPNWFHEPNDTFNRQTLCLADCAKAKQGFDTLEKFIPLKKWSQ